MPGFLSHGISKNAHEVFKDWTPVQCFPALSAWLHRNEDALAYPEALMKATKKHLTTKADNRL
jgi:hypothetical protein